MRNCYLKYFILFENEHELNEHKNRSLEYSFEGFLSSDFNKESFMLFGEIRNIFLALIHK